MVADDVTLSVGVEHQKLVLVLPSGDVALLFELVGFRIEFGLIPAWSNVHVAVPSVTARPTTCPVAAVQTNLFCDVLHWLNVPLA